MGSTVTGSPGMMSMGVMNGCDASGVMCHIDGVCVGGWGECEHGGVKVSGGSGILWQVNRGVVDEDGAMGGATGS